MKKCSEEQYVFWSTDTDYLLLMANAIRHVGGWVFLLVSPYTEVIISVLLLLKSTLSFTYFSPDISVKDKQELH